MDGTQVRGKKDSDHINGVVLAFLGEAGGARAQEMRASMYSISST